MTQPESAAPTQKNRYREMALAVRALIPSMQYADARDQLSLLALQYERLAQGLEAVSESLRAPAAQRLGEV